MFFCGIPSEVFSAGVAPHAVPVHRGYCDSPEAVGRFDFRRVEPCAFA